MRKVHGLDLSQHAPKHLDTFAGSRFDWVVSLCDRVREVCPEFPGAPEAVHWSIPNPASASADELDALFREVADEIAMRVDYLLAAIADRSAARTTNRRRSNARHP